MKYIPMDRYKIINKVGGCVYNEENGYTCGENDSNDVVFHFYYLFFLKIFKKKVFFKFFSTSKNLYKRLDCNRSERFPSVLF
jgi:hypothetical protein